MSIAGQLSRAVERARELECGTMQIFSRSPRGWKTASLDPAEVRRFRRLREAAGITPLVIHSSYLINLASPQHDLFERSVDAVGEELVRADRLGADFLVVHVGSDAAGGPEAGIPRVVDALRRIRKFRSSTRLVLENTAGERGDIGSTVEELGEILRNLGDPDWPGLCMDTCHAFAAGYDLSRPDGVKAWVQALDAGVGMDRVQVLHMNDSKKGLNCRVDRHEHIGKGKIGSRGFGAIVRHPMLRRIPMILETPKESDADDRRNLNLLHRLSARP